jgi:hypothetical protein
MLIRLNNGIAEGYPILQSNFLRLFPTTSFTLPLQPEDVEPFGYGIYEATDKPEPDRYKNVVEAPAVKDPETGVWHQAWTQEDMTTEERAEADAHQANLMRNLREFKLIACDWTQVADSPVDGSLWLAYRQALRDVPSQPGFPWDITWPEEP